MDKKKLECPLSFEGNMLSEIPSLYLIDPLVCITAEDS